MDSRLRGNDDHRLREDDDDRLREDDDGRLREDDGVIYGQSSANSVLTPPG